MTTTKTLSLHVGESISLWNRKIHSKASKASVIFKFQSFCNVEGDFISVRLKGLIEFFRV